MNDALLISRNECPLCKNGPRKAKVCPRRALQEHIRSSKDKAHIMWREQHYAAHFKHGGKMSEQAVTTADVIEAVQKSFGIDWAQRISVN